MTKENEEIFRFFYHVLTEHPDDILVVEAKEKNTGKPRIILSIRSAAESTDEEAVIYPVAVLFGPDQNPFDIYEFEDVEEVVNSSNVVCGDELTWWERHAPSWWPF